MSRHQWAQEKATLATVSIGLWPTALHKHKTVAHQVLWIHVKNVSSPSLSFIITCLCNHWSGEGCEWGVRSQISAQAANQSTVWCCHDSSFQQFQALFSCRLSVHGMCQGSLYSGPLPSVLLNRVPKLGPCLRHTRSQGNVMNNALSPFKHLWGHFA